MRFFRTLPLFALLVGLPFLLNATCITRVDQKGPAGPWTGEVVNSGSYPIEASSVQSRIVDANGKDVAFGVMKFCPPIQPGEKGYFIVSAVSPAVINNASGPITLPLHIGAIEGYSSRPPFASDLIFQVLRIYPEHNAVIVAMKNNSTNIYRHLLACGVLLSPSGQVQSIGQKRVYPGAVFAPGDTITFPIQFHSWVDGGSFVFGLDANFGSALDTELPPAAFQLGAYKVVDTASGRQLQVVGEIENTSGIDLGNVLYEAYLTTSPTVRVSGNVCPNGADFRTGDNYYDGCGLVLAGEKAPVRFSLPLDPNDSPQVEIAGIDGATLESVAPAPYFKIPVTNIQRQRVSSESVRVTATIRNPTTVHALLGELCFDLRGSNGKLVGNACGGGPSLGLDPGQSTTVSRVVSELAPSTSVDVIAYGFKGVPVVPPTSGLY